MSIDTPALRAAIARLHAAMERDADMLNTADGALGDGDLGVTMTRGMALVAASADDLPDDLGRALLTCAQAFTKSSGSSYGTLLATGLMAVAKAVKGETEIPASRVSELAALARDAMQARGKAELGGKTVLDSLDALSTATAESTETTQVAEAAARSVEDALDTYRDKKATIGRARIFGDKSVGLDDPGMLAMARIVSAVTATE